MLNQSEEEKRKHYEKKLGSYFEKHNKKREGRFVASLFLGLRDKALSPTLALHDSQPS